jgi:carbon-monoxide dehydrogenase small subunit
MGRVTMSLTQPFFPNMPTVSFRLNGAPVELQTEERALLVDVLRTHFGQTGTHVGCDTSQCGACTVLLDQQSVKSCTVLAVQVAGAEVVTIEGLAPAESMHPIQQAFIECHGLQCGFCTPGMIMTAWCLLRANPSPSEADIVHALEGNLCRCTGYVNIIAAVRQAAEVLRDAPGERR